MRKASPSSPARATMAHRIASLRRSPMLPASFPARTSCWASRILRERSEYHIRGRHQSADGGNVDRELRCPPTSSENADFDPRLPAVFTFDGVSATVGNNTWGSGGGFSQIFSKPLVSISRQHRHNVHRSVPDVSLMMGGCPSDADLAAQDCTRLAAQRRHRLDRRQSRPF